MKIQYAICAISLPFLSQCISLQPKNPSIVIDDNMNPYGASQQLDFSSWRGEVGHRSLNSKDFPDAAVPYYDRIKNKSWILQNWGSPDEIQKKNGIEYLIFSKKSKSAPHYDMQFCNGLNPVKLGYRNNQLVYIEAYFPDNPGWIKGPIFRLPK